MANSYIPSAKMIRDLFESHGFREYRSVAELRVGGMVFFRRHPDGRLQMAYVFSWSNFGVAEEKGHAPCVLWVRATLDAGASEEEAWRSASHAEGIAIGFQPREFKTVVEDVRHRVIPIFDAPLEEGERLLGQDSSESVFD